MAIQLHIEKLLKDCQETMSSLESALQKGDFESGKEYLRVAQTLSGAFESKLDLKQLPQTVEASKVFYDVKSKLLDAISEASFKLDDLEGDSINSTNRYSFFDSHSSYAEHQGNVQVADFDFESPKF